MLDADQGVLKDDGLRASEANPALPGMAAERPRPRPFETTGGRGRVAISARWVTAGILAWILLFGLSLRLTNVNWDHNQALHPDERFLMIITDKLRAPESVGQYWDSADSPLNPYNHNNSFVYGTFPLFLNKSVAEWLDRDADGSTHASANIVKWPLEAFGADFDRESGTRNFDGGYNSRVVGRTLSALADVLTIILLFELGRILYGRWAGLLAAGFLAATVLHIQHAHFFGSETFLALFVTAVIYFSVRIWKYGGFWNFALAGLFYGLALATKLSAITVILVPALAITMRMWPALETAYHYLTGRTAPWLPDTDAPPPRTVPWQRIATPVLLGLAGLAVTLLTFRIFQPYAFAGPGFFDIFRWDLSLRDDVFSPSAITHLEFIRPKHYLNLDERYLKDISSLLDQQSGNTDFPPAMQWIGRERVIFPFMNIFLWGLGVPLALATLGGVAYAIWLMARRFVHPKRLPADVTGLIPVFWILFHFLFIARGFNPTMRYFIPIYPVMALMAAFAVVSLWNFARTERARELFRGRLARLNEYAAPAMRVAAAAVVVGTAIWALAFLGIYRQDISRVQATHWINDNIPNGSIVTGTEWDDGLPLGIEDPDRPQLTGVQIKAFGPNSEAQVTEMVDTLDQADYVIESSNRAYDSVTRFPAKYPSTILYYEYLFDGTLGFEKVAEFTNYPTIFGIDIPDQSSEEAFTVYDHPKVTIFEKTDAWDRDRALELLEVEKADTAFTANPIDAFENGLIFRRDVLEKQQAGGTWTDIFKPDSFVSEHPLIFWVLIMQLAAVALVPITIVVFRGLPDRGYLLTKPLGVIGFAYLVYLPSSHGLTDFTRATIGGVLTFMVLAGAATAYLWRDEVREFFTQRWRFVLLCEALFIVMLLFSYWLRVQNPDLFHPTEGGEKPMDLAYLNGVIRTTDLTQGAIDPWYSGGYLNYYWWGFFIAAVPTKLLGIVPEVAYNLIVPMFYALSAAAAFSVVYNLAEGTRRLMRRRPNRTRIGRAGPIIAALLGVFFVLVAGNLRAVDVLAGLGDPSRGLDQISPWHPDIFLLGPVITMIGGLKEIFFGDASLRAEAYAYDWWAPSRALVPLEGEVQPITEFPFWTFLFADLHAHLMSIPFALTAVGVALGAVLNFSRLNPARLARSTVWSSWAMVLLLALVVGALRWINTWDYPVFMAMAAAGLVLGEFTKYRGITWHMLGWSIAKVGVMAFLANFVLFSVTKANYHLSKEYTEFPPPRSTQTTDLSDFLSHFGVFLFFIGVLALFMLARTLVRERAYRFAFFGRRRVTTVEALPVLGALIVFAIVVTTLGTFERWGAFWLSAMGLLAIVLLAVRELRRNSPLSPLLLFVYSAIAVGLGLTALVEVYTLNGDIGRMNTVFKFYLHTWQLWGLAAAYGAWLLFDVMRPRVALPRRLSLRAPRVRTRTVEFGTALEPQTIASSAASAGPAAVRSDPGRAFAWVFRYAFAAIAALLLILTLVYPYFGGRARIANRFDNAPHFTGNDGLEWLDKVEVYDNTGQPSGGGPHELKYTRDAITWARLHIDGTPTTIEGVGDRYRSISSRFSIYAGLPTVAAWEFHQLQQRTTFSATVQERQADVLEFYTTPDATKALDIIAKYGAEYVIVGDEEKFIYPEEGLEKFKGGLGGRLELSYENPAIQIWHVIPEDELPGASATAP